MFRKDFLEATPISVVWKSAVQFTGQQRQLDPHANTTETLAVQLSRIRIAAGSFNHKPLLNKLSSLLGRKKIGTGLLS